MGGPGECGCSSLFARERFIKPLFYPWKPPPPSRVQVVPLPPATPSYGSWGHGEDDGVNRDGEYENSSGGGPYNYQPTQQWTNVLVQETESSMNFAAAKPKNRENESQSEVSIFYYLAEDHALYEWT